MLKDILNKLVGRPDAGSIDFSIDGYLDNLRSVVRPSRYAVMIGDNEHNMLAHTVSLPTRVTQVRQDNTYAVGRTLKSPYATDIGDLTISFYTNHDGKSSVDDNLLFFENWASGTSPNSIIYNKPDGKSNQYVRFFEDIAKQNIMVNQYSDTGDIINTWMFLKVFPISVAYDQLSYSTKDQVWGVSVTFDVEDYFSLNVPFRERSAGGLYSGIKSFPTDGIPASMIEFAGGDSAGFQVDDGESGPQGFLGLGGELAKKMGKNAVKNIINGQPVEFDAQSKQNTAYYAGDVVGSLVEDPAQSQQAKQGAISIMMDQPDKTNRSSRKLTENRMNNLIDGLF